MELEGEFCYETGHTRPPLKIKDCSSTYYGQYYTDKSKALKVALKRTAQNIEKNLEITNNLTRETAALKKRMEMYEKELKELQ